MYSAGNVCKVPQGNYKVRSVWQWLSHQMINIFLIKFVWLKFYIYNFMTYCIHEIWQLIGENSCCKLVYKRSFSCNADIKLTDIFEINVDYLRKETITFSFRILWIWRSRSNSAMYETSKWMGNSREKISGKCKSIWWTCWSIICLLDNKYIPVFLRFWIIIHVGPTTSCHSA